MDFVGSSCPVPVVVNKSPSKTQQLFLLFQGRYGKGKGQEYLEQFLVEYRRPGMQDWRVYSNNKGKQVINLLVLNARD